MQWERFLCPDLYLFTFYDRNPFKSYMLSPKCQRQQAQDLHHREAMYDDDIQFSVSREAFGQNLKPPPS